ncbi:MAG: hypothetical protein WCD37_02720 [Chloroflexia bacterium]
MDIIRFEIAQISDEADELLIFINGRNLVDLLKEIEAVHAEREGSPSIAGGYAGLAPIDVLLPSQHFLGKPAEEVYRYTDKVSVLECECGFPGCWPFLVKITIDSDIVTWSDFEQPHRGAEQGTGQWTYETLRPFVFERIQYMAELDAISKAFRGKT